ncbi:phosphohistidine phosphatase SixA [Serratia oryzae]|jgi:phosphohistidine phosphatase|uniref:Phosphohistidine phosphatase SixA n=1 Tax=Serratia oryzae TaxID=2034155 RepID=A0A1S8CMV4_9GAMM|nr:phosphohistidine phosphatase SixA [Serratia oryzae]OMQ24784.1 phosphohistidine phosphatase SixA [Serratia oryzae]
MQVLIMRHGEAVLEAASDSVRPLTECGREESRQMAAWLNAQSVNIERVLVSPYLRAEQTLEVVREALTLPEGAEILPELTPGGDAGLVSCYLQVLAKEGVGAVLVVSHLPLVGYLVAELCPGECPPMFATSAIANVELASDGSSGTFAWQVGPSQVMAKVC